MALISAGIGAAGSILGGFLGGDNKGPTAANRGLSSANLGFGLTQANPDGTITQDANQFSDLSRLFAGQAQQQLGLNPNLINVQNAGFGQPAIRGARDAVGNQFMQLQNAMGNTNQFDPNAFAALQFDRLQGLADRGEALGAENTANRLFASGRLGRDDTASGNAFEGLARAQGDARTGRALQATQLANQEAQRLFQQDQTGIMNQFGLLQQLTGNQQNTVQNFGQLTGMNQAAQQQALQNALGFGGAAGSVLQPNFTTLQAVMNSQANDQASRSGVASNNASIQANQAASRADAVGNAFAGFADAFANR